MTAWGISKRRVILVDGQIGVESNPRIDLVFLEKPGDFFGILMTHRDELNRFLRVMRYQIIQVWNTSGAWGAPRTPEIKNHHLALQSLPIYLGGLGTLEHKLKTERGCLVTTFQRIRRYFL